MKLVDKPCYPIKTVNLDKMTETHHLGLTFRERLIIALAGNPAIVSNQVGTDFAKLLINKADAIIKRLEDEKH